MQEVEGGCLCGAVRLKAVGMPYRVGICHCLDCRKHHGALFHASAIFPQEAVAVSGETQDYAGRNFCPRCGSSVFGRSGDEVEVNLGTLDEIDRFVELFERVHLDLTRQVRRRGTHRPDEAAPRVRPDAHRGSGDDRRRRRRTGRRRSRRRSSRQKEGRYPPYG